MENKRPFTIRRVARPGSSVTATLMVTKREWTELSIQTVYKSTCKSEDLSVATGCTVHKGCKGHHMKDQNSSPYMMLFMFATGASSGTATRLQSTPPSAPAVTPRLTSLNYCLGMIKGKIGILHKQCNSIRLTNTMSCMESPVKPDLNASMAEQLGYIYLLSEFLFMAEDGKFDTAKLMEKDLVKYGRCTSQAMDGALLLKARRTVEGESSMRVPLDVCSKTNTKFKCDKAQLFKPVTKDVCKGMSVAWKRIWNGEGRKNVYLRLTSLVNQADGDSDVDPAIYTTMPLEDMVDQPGGDMYEALMLMPKSWNVMGKTKFSESYWQTWFTRSLDCIVNSTMVRHGIGKQYTDMRNTMMLGMVLAKYRTFMRVRTTDPQPIPAVKASKAMSYCTCLSASR